ncbi:MAG: NnrS family protein [Flavisolibacter sp.]
MDKTISEPYRWFFPMGVLFLFWGSLIWLPQIWSSDAYPVLAHRFLMLNGFTSCFIAGFLMTAIPRFSQTRHAHIMEILAFTFVTLLGLILAYKDQESLVAFLSATQAMILIFFIGSRITQRKQNPPYTFIFIFAGMILWMVSGLHMAFTGSDSLKSLHYEGAIAAIILGVGSRLIPGILGHTEIVQSQREIYEKPVSLFKTIPKSFLIIMAGFVFSYFFTEHSGYLRAIVVSWIAFRYWQIYKAPKEKTSLTWCIWFSAWMIAISFIARAFVTEGEIHVSHSFFLGGIVLLSLLIGTRVIQSHGPKDKKLENKKVLYWVSGLILIAMLTRVTAYYMPESYLRHLGYSSIVLVSAVGLWSFNYLGYIMKRAP